MITPSLHLLCLFLTLPLLADSNALQELPVHILHKITMSLDVKSQHSLFLSSSQLYSKWHLQIPDNDCQWQFVQQSINLLEQFALEQCRLKSSSSNGISVHCTSSTSAGRITCTTKNSSVHFNLLHIKDGTPGRSSKPDQTGLTKDQLWHRLTAIPDLQFASITLVADARKNNPARLKRFAEQCFGLLCNSRGFLTFYMRGLEDSYEEIEPGYHALKVLHGNSKDGQSYWDLDGETCIVSPPKLDFQNMPREVKSIQAQFVSEGPPAQAYLHPDDPLTCFYPDSEVLSDFAYNGNVDIDAWLDMMHENAADWYDHMDDLADEGVDFDDMDDLDDADMAQLLGAMQG